jgi:Effector Associated Constant Component 1
MVVIDARDLVTPNELPHSVLIYTRLTGAEMIERDLWVHISYVPSDEDAASIGQATESLVQDLSYLDFDRLEPVAAGPAPTGTRAGELVAVGEVAGLLASPAVLGATVSLIGEWLRRRGGSGTVKVKIGEDELELSAATAEQQEALTRKFMAKHGSPSVD